MQLGTPLHQTRSVSLRWCAPRSHLTPDWAGRAGRPTTPRRWTPQRMLAGRTPPRSKRRRHGSRTRVHDAPAAARRRATLSKKKPAFLRCAQHVPSAKSPVQDRTFFAQYHQLPNLGVWWSLVRIQSPRPLLSLVFTERTGSGVLHLDSKILREKPWYSLSVHAGNTWLGPHCGHAVRMRSPTQRQRGTTTRTGIWWSRGAARPALSTVLYTSGAPGAYGQRTGRQGTPGQAVRDGRPPRGARPAVVRRAAAGSPHVIFVEAVRSAMTSAECGSRPGGGPGTPASGHSRHGARQRHRLRVGFGGAAGPARQVAAPTRDARP
jgi:hypothetical protein